MRNINKILLTTTILLILIIGSFLGWQMMSRNESYYAVLTLGGDLFFGKYHFFPKPYLTDVWTLQRNPEDEKNPVSLVKFEQSIWGPEDILYLNKRNIVWKTKLKADSQVVSQIKNPKAVQPPSQAPQQQLPRQPLEEVIGN